MSAEITASVLTNQILTEAIKAEVGEEIRENAILLSLCDIQDIGSIPTLTGSWQQHNAMTVSGITDGTGLSNATYSQDNQTATASGYGVKFVMTDLGLASTVADHKLAIPQSAMMDVVDKMDATVGAALGTFTGASQNVGSTGVNPTFAIMLSAVTNLKLNAKGFADRGAVFVLHPQQVYDLQTLMTGTFQATALTTTQAVSMAPIYNKSEYVSLLGEGRVLSSIVGSFMGIPVLSSTNVATANSGADRAGALLVKGEALGAVLKFAPTFELQRTIVDGIPGWAGMAWCAFAVAEKRDVCGVTVLSDA
jgi:hypothetical protein